MSIYIKGEFEIMLKILKALVHIGHKYSWDKKGNAVYLLDGYIYCGTGSFSDTYIFILTGHDLISRYRKLGINNEIDINKIKVVK